MKLEMKITIRLEKTTWFKLNRFFPLVLNSISQSPRLVKCHKTNNTEEDYFLKKQNILLLELLFYFAPVLDNLKLCKDEWRL